MYIQIQISVPDQEIGSNLAKVLVEEKWAACVQVLGPIQSFYTWEGKLEEAQEWLLLCKTRGDLFEGIAERVKSVHPYEVPEIIGSALSDVDEAYGEWLLENIR